MVRLFDGTIKRDTIGDGPTGAKSAALRRYTPLFEAATWKDKNQEDSGFVILPHVSITPAFFADFLKRAGASYERPDEAVAAIRATEFSTTELDGIREVLEPFTDYHVAVRSDESTAAGVGLWHTDFMRVEGKSVERAATILKRILEVDFSRDVLAFKRRVGLKIDENPGVFVMPVFGMNLDRTSEGVILTTPYHVNMITSFRGIGTVVNLGMGIGGANNGNAQSRWLKDLQERNFDPNGLLSPNFIEARVLAQGNLTGKMDHLTKDYFKILSGTLVSEALEELRNGVASIVRAEPSPLYVELAVAQNLKWTFLQCAPVNFEALDPVVRLRTPNEQKVLRITPEPFLRTENFGRYVSGRRVIKAEQVAYIEEDQLDKVKEINRIQNDYVMFVKCGFHEFNRSLSFADYSNAAAIIFINYNPSFNAATHFNGALREAGIVILAGRVDKKFLDSLKLNCVTNKKVLVYADDGAEEAFVATTD